jgi:large subunit ribosomal protein L15
MQLHEIRPRKKIRRIKRVGRGGKRGTYSGAGQKGQRSRAGRKLKPAIRSLIKRYPKLRGYRFRAVRGLQTVVNVELLEKEFSVGSLVTPQNLLEKKLIRRIKGRLPKVKILGRGKLLKKLIVKDCQVSKSAKEKIEKAGGVISE